MIKNRIDTKSARELKFLTHTFYVERVGRFVSALCTINQNVYFEMEYSSRHYSYSSSLRDRNIESLAGTLSKF